MHSGEEIIGHVMEENDEMVLLQDALKINYVYQDSSVPALYLSKYFIYLESWDVEFDKNEVSYIFRQFKPQFVTFHRTYAMGLKRRLSAVFDDEKSDVMEREDLVEAFIDGDVEPSGNTYH
jgi:hypothetical protein